MRNAWVTNEGAAAAQALNQEAGDVHAPCLREKSTPATEPRLAPRLFRRHRDMEDMAPSIVVHHKHTSVVGPEQPSKVQHSSARIDSTTMTGPDLAATVKLHPDPSRTWAAPRTQSSFDQSA